MLILRDRLSWNPNDQGQMDRLMNRFDVLGRRIQAQSERQRGV